MKKSILDRVFKHSTWFKGQGKTTREVLDYFAKNGYTVRQRPSKKQLGGLFDPISYDNCIIDGRSSYKLSEEEILYYTERMEYWKEQKRIEEDNWLNSEIDAEKEIHTFLFSNTKYSTRQAESEIKNWEKYLGTYEEAEEMIKKWQDRKSKILETKQKIDSLLLEFKDRIKTNRDMIEFKNMVDSL